MSQDPLSLEPPNGDFVRHIDRLQSGKIPDLRPLEAEDPASALPGTPSTKSGGLSMRDLMHAFRKREAADNCAATIARMESSSKTPPAAPAPAPRRKKADPWQRFITSALMMFGMMGILIGVDSNEAAPVIFGGFAVFAGAFIQIASRLQGSRSASGASGRSAGRSSISIRMGK